MGSQERKNGISRKKRSKLRAGEKGLSWDYQDPKGKLISDKMADSTYENHLEAEALFLLIIVAFIGIFLDFLYTRIRNRLLMWKKA